MINKCQGVDPLAVMDVLLLFNKSGSSFPAYTWMIARDGLENVDILASSEHPVLRSKWCRQHDSFHTAEEFYAKLKSNVQQGNYRAVLCIDESSRNLLFHLSNEEWLKPYLPFPHGSPLFQACSHKVLFQQWCERNAIPVPEARSGSSGEEVLAAAEAIGFPHVLKGAVGSRGVEVHVIRSREMLLGVLSASPHQKSWLVQEFIKGPVGSTSIAARDGKIYAICSSYKYMSLSGGTGPSSIRKFLSHPELNCIAERVVAASGVSGVTGYDWMEVSPGDFRIIDPHLGRSPSSVLVSHYNNVDICRAFHSSLTKGEPVPPDGEKGRNCLGDATDDSHPFRGRVPLGHETRQSVTKGCFYFLVW